MKHRTNERWRKLIAYGKARFGTAVMSDILSNRRFFLQNLEGVNFNHLHLHDVDFTNCSLNNAQFYAGVYKHLTFYRCAMNKTFMAGRFFYTTFHACDLRHVWDNNALLVGSDYNNCFNNLYSENQIRDVLTQAILYTLDEYEPEYTNAQIHHLLVALDEYASNLGLVGYNEGYRWREDVLNTFVADKTARSILDDMWLEHILSTYNTCDLPDDVLDYFGLENYL